jgi:DNA mismatch repair protein MutS2
MFEMRSDSRGSSSKDEPVLDLHGLRVDEAIRRTSAFLVRERERGTISVRVVTGHGTGALKKAVGELMRSHPAVSSLRPSLGSDAAMLVVLKPPARGG